MNIRPLQDHVLIEIEPQPKTNGVLHLPDGVSQQRGVLYGRVVRTGVWKQAKNTGALIPHEVKPGDRVAISQYAGTQMNRDIGERFKLVRSSEILAIVENSS